MTEITLASHYTKRTVQFQNTTYRIKRRVHFNCGRETVLFVVKERWYHRLWNWLIGKAS